MSFTLAILYAPKGQRPLSIAKIDDRNLFGVAAKRAVFEAESAATSLMSGDPTLGAFQLEEANKLRRILSRFLPK